MHYLATIKTKKVGEDGLVQTVSEKYLINALTYTEAEERVTNEVAPYSEEIDVSGLQRQNVADIITSDDPDADKWYLGKVGIITLDEKTAKEKRVAVRVYIQSASFKDAYDALLSYMHSSMSEFVVLSITETSVIDYFA